MPLMTYIDAITTALREEMQHDERVYIIGEDVGVIACGGKEVTLRTPPCAGGPDAKIEIHVMPDRRLYGADFLGDVRKFVKK